MAFFIVKPNSLFLNLTPYNKENENPNPPI